MIPMNEWDPEDWTFFLFIALALCAIMYAGAMVLTTVYANTSCWRAGYPQAKVTPLFTIYCIKRQDQTDRVIPLEEAVKP